jgi:hypothetical protein
MFDAAVTSSNVPSCRFRKSRCRARAATARSAYEPPSYEKHVEPSVVVEVEKKSARPDDLGKNFSSLAPLTWVKSSPACRATSRNVGKRVCRGSGPGLGRRSRAEAASRHDGDGDTRGDRPSLQQVHKSAGY